MPASSISCLQCPYFPLLTQFLCLVALKGGGVLDEDEGGKLDANNWMGVVNCTKGNKEEGIFCPS